MKFYCLFAAMAVAATASAQMKMMPLTAGDRAFAIKVAQLNIAEVTLGNIAEKNAMKPMVKDFGTQMVNDHTKFRMELQNWAKPRRLALPNRTDPAHAAVIAKLSKLKGARFDKEYTAAMVDGHKKAVAEFSAQVSAGKDRSLKQWARRTLMVLKSHLSMAMSMQRYIK